MVEFRVGDQIRILSKVIPSWDIVVATKVEDQDGFYMIYNGHQNYVEKRYVLQNITHDARESVEALIKV